MKKFKTLIDVRSELEYDNGHVANSINIPMQNIQSQLKELEEMPSPIALCCQSGGRSGVVTNFLQDKGLDCFNAGGWKSVEFSIENGTLCWDN